MYINIVQSFPLYRLNVVISREDDNTTTGHFFFCSKSGIIIDIQPEKGIVRNVLSNSYNITPDNFYPIISYGWKGNMFLFQSNETSSKNTPNLISYDPVSGEIEFIEMRDKVGKYSLDTTSYEAISLYRALISTDGHILGSNLRINAAPTTWMYNTETKSFDFIKKDSMPLIHQRHGASSSQAIEIDSGGAFDGIYHSCWWDDIGNYIFEVVRAEALANNLVLKGNNKFFIHDLDRALVSTTRRIIAVVSINGATKAWYTIDVKSPSTFYKSSFFTGSTQNIYTGLTSYTWRDESNNLVNLTNWTKGDLIQVPYSTGTTVSKPTYSVGFFYCSTFTVGRFGYMSGYIANKNYQFYLPIALQDGNGLTKGDLLIPPNWPVIDVGTDFWRTSAVIYLCNFGGINGYSNEDEYVCFISHPISLLYGYLNATTYDFIIYNPVTDPNNYVIRGPITLNKSEFNCWFDDVVAAETNTILIEGEEYYYDSVFNVKPFALKKDYLINIDQTQGVCDIAFTIIPDKNKPHQKIIKGLSNLPTTNGNLLNTTEMGENELLFAGVTYSGIILKEREIDDSLTHIYSWPGLSYKGSLRINTTKVLYYGYMGSIHLFDLSLSPQNARKIIFINNVIPEINYVGKYTDDIVFISGNFVRTASYISNYGGFGYSNLNTLTSFLFPNLSNDVKINTGYSVRVSFKLINSTYTDNNAETIFATYITLNGLTRLQGIALLENTCKYSTQGIEAYNDNSGKFIIPLEWEGISGLKGYRINELANGSGTWHTSNDTLGTSVGTANVVGYPKAIFVNKADKVLSTLVNSDYKYVQFTDLLNKSLAGRLVITDTYIAFLDIENSNSRCAVRVISKTNFEAAALGTGNATFDSTIYIALNSTGGNFGFGAQGGDYDFFGVSGTPRNSWVVVGDYIFITISSNVNTSNPYICVIRINLTDATQVVWCTDTIQTAAKGITYNPDTDTAFVTRDATTFRIENFTTLTPPYLLV